MNSRVDTGSPHLKPPTTFELACIVAITEASGQSTSPGAIAMFRTVILASALTLSLLPMAWANESSVTLFDEDVGWLRINQASNIKVVVDDQVTGGCWPEPSSAKTAVELEFIRSNYQVEDDILIPRITVRAIGYSEMDIRCAVWTEFQVEIPEVTRFSPQEREVKSFYYRTLWSNGILLTGPRSDMGSRITASLEDLTKSFLVNVSRMKSRILSEVEKENESMAQFLKTTLK
jgi:hypothetical protein